MKRKTSLIILLLASIAVHFAFFGKPNEIVFDEVHFGKFISAYYTHKYYFDIHPPGGKLIIAGFAKLFKFTPEYSFGQIGQPFPDNKYLALRFLPSLAGALLPIVIFILAMELGLSAMGAFGAGMLVVLENALLTQSRYILLDPFLLLFGFSALLFYFKYRNTVRQTVIRNSKFIIPMAIAGGLSMSIKWTGIAFLGLIGIIEIVDTINQLRINNYRLKDRLKRAANFILYFLLIPLALYFSVFAIHFSLLGRSGDGDAFMTPAFQSTLEGSAYATDPSVKPLNIFQKFTELNIEMYKANQTLTASHPYGSAWYTWPFMIRPIYYWNHTSTTAPTESKIYLIGNPLIWWSSTIAIFYLLISSISDWVVARIKHQQFVIRNSQLIILGGFLINLLPFIGISRVMFLYHYLSALIFAILALAYLIDQQKNRRNILIVFLALSAISFLYFSPLSYGLPMEAASFQQRFWFPSWQ